MGVFFKTLDIEVKALLFSMCIFAKLFTYAIKLHLDQNKFLTYLPQQNPFLEIIRVFLINLCTCDNLELEGEHDKDEIHYNDVVDWCNDLWTLFGVTINVR